MRHDVGDGFELDDDRARVDVDAVHAFLSEESYWAAGRPRADTERVIREATRVVGLYRGERQLGFCRVTSDGLSFAYLADVYVRSEARGRGLGLALVREAIEHGPRVRRWMLHTRDAHGLYAKLGFAPPTDWSMEYVPPA